MDEFNKFRKEFFINGKSVYKIAKEYNRSWETVSKIIKVPEHLIHLRGQRTRNAKVATPEVLQKIHEYIQFEVSHKVPKKQRFTAKVIFKKLQDEGLYTGSAKRMRTIVAQVRSELKSKKEKNFLNLDFEIGKYLQVDHGEVDIFLGDKQVQGYLFVASPPGTSLRYCQFFLTKAAEAWGEFHERSFKYFDGVFDHVMYDNDSVLKNNQTNTETVFSVEMQIHYGFKAIYCNKASGWEKGAVENGVGFCRRNFLAGIETFGSLEEINKHLNLKSEALTSELHYLSRKPLGHYLQEIKKTVNPLPSKKKWGKWMDLKVDSFQQIRYQDHAYSLPGKYVGSKISAFVTAYSIEIYSDITLVFTHPRKFITGEDSLILDHYLDQLSKKPMSIGHAKVMKLEKFSNSLMEFWSELKRKMGEKSGNIQFVQTLMLKRASSIVDFETSIELALSYQAISYDAVKSILHQLQISQVRSTEDHPSLLREDDFNLNNYQQLQE